MVRRRVWWVRNMYSLMLLFPLSRWAADGWPLDPAEEEPGTGRHDDQADPDAGAISAPHGVHENSILAYRAAAPQTAAAR